MSFRVAAVGRVFCVRWEGIPSADNLELLLKRLERCQVSKGEKLIYVAVVPNNVNVPEGQQRHALSRFGKRATPFVTEAHLVLEGDGFKNSLQRSVATALFTLRRTAVRVHCHKTLEQATDEIALKTGGTSNELCAAIKLEFAMPKPPAPASPSATAASLADPRK